MLSAPRPLLCDLRGTQGRDCIQNTNLSDRYFLDVFVKLRKSDYLLCHASLSVCPHGTARLLLVGFHEIWYLFVFRKYVEKIQVPFKQDKGNGYFTWRLVCVFSNMSLSFLRKRNASERTCAENQNVHFMLHNLYIYTHRVIQEESALLWKMIVWVILSKKVHMNMGPILNGYGVMGIF